MDSSNFTKAQADKLKSDITKLLMKYRVPKSQLRIILDDVVWWVDESAIICDESVQKDKIPHFSQTRHLL